MLQIRLLRIIEREDASAYAREKKGKKLPTIHS